MKNSSQHPDLLLKSACSNSTDILRIYFTESLKELYFAENAISAVFTTIRDQVRSHKLQAILTTHFQIHLNHKYRLERIFRMQNERPEAKHCVSISALLNEANERFSQFSADRVNWEIAMILTSRKLAHYKIAAYGAAAHLAINLNAYPAATLLAVNVQEEEEFVDKHLNRITHDFLRPNSEGFTR